MNGDKEGTTGDEAAAQSRSSALSNLTNPAVPTTAAAAASPLGLNSPAGLVYIQAGQAPNASVQINPTCLTQIVAFPQHLLPGATLSPSAASQMAYQYALQPNAGAAQSYQTLSQALGQQQALQQQALQQQALQQQAMLMNTQNAAGVPFQWQTSPSGATFQLMAQSPLLQAQQPVQFLPAVRYVPVPVQVMPQQAQLPLSNQAWQNLWQGGQLLPGLSSPLEAGTAPVGMQQFPGLPLQPGMGGAATLGFGQNPTATLPNNALTAAAANTMIALSSQEAAGLGGPVQPNLPKSAAVTDNPSNNSPSATSPGKKLKSDRQEHFPEKLLRMLDEIEKADKDDIISYTVEGKGFEIHRPDAFEEEILPLYFKHNKMASFRRQLSSYAYYKLEAGPEKGAYTHKFFKRGRPDLAQQIKVIQTKKKKKKPAKDEED